MSKAASAKPRAKAASKPAKEALPALQPRKLLVQGPQRQVFIIDDADQLTDVSTLQCISLMHPKHGKPCRYLHTSSSLWEVQRVYQPPSSWIIQHDLQEDGSFYLCTRIDPLFLALPIMERGRKKTADHAGHFMQLDQLLPKSDFPTALLDGSSGAIGKGYSAHTLCDVRDGWKEPVLRLNDEKVIAWLRAKVARMTQKFKTVPSLKHLYSGAELAEKADEAATSALAAVPAAVESSAEEQKSHPTAAADDASTTAVAASSPPPPATPTPPAAAALPASLKQSLAFLSEYLSPSTFLLLLSSYSLAMEDVFERKRAAAKSWESSGRISGDIDTSRPAGTVPQSDTKRKSEKPLSAAAKKLASAAKGTKSVASFFMKKAPTT